VTDVLQAAPLKVLVTGAAGQIAYSLVNSVAKGDVFGPNQVHFYAQSLCRFVAT